MSTDDEPQTAVGYGRPPKHHQFAKGQSGNPKGRPKQPQDLSTLFAQSLDETVIVAEKGRRKKITKFSAIIKQIVNKAAAGDARSIKLFMEHMHRNKIDIPRPQPIFIISETDSRL